MEKRNIFIWIVVAIVLVVAGYLISLYLYQNTSTTFSQDGTIVKDEPTLKEGTWYLMYKDQDSKNVIKELSLSGVDTSKFKKLETVHVEGKESNNIVAVSTVNILNAYNDDWIWALDPLPNQAVTSPMTISGEARGNWYFEASFPVKLLDANGKVLAQAPAKAQGDWMVQDYVPFTATLTFNKPTTLSGTLVLQKDNPSGLPQNANELRIPVNFGTSNTTVNLYYYDAQKDKDASGNVLCSQQGIVPVQRQIAVSTTPIQDAINLLLQGNITQEEKAQGISTEYPLQGVQLKGANLANGVLTLEFSDPNNKTSGGSCRVSLLWKQIEATAKQFPGVTSVKFIPSTLFQP